MKWPRKHPKPKRRKDESDSLDLENGCENEKKNGQGSDRSIDPTSSMREDKESYPPQARPSINKSNNSIAILRLTVVVVWGAAAIIVCFFVQRFTRRAETREFEIQYQYDANKLLQSFESAIDRKLGAINTMASAITTHARYTNQTFPFVTYPDFGVAGSNTRVLADGLLIHWLPLVFDDDREEWEKYAFEHRFQVDETFKQENELRERQDNELGFADQNERFLSGKQRQRKASTNELANDEDSKNITAEIEVINNMVQDGTRFHPKIFDFPINVIRENGTGPYLPLWQRSPVNGAKQFTLNIDLANSKGLKGIFPYMLNNPRGALLNRAQIPNPDVEQLMNENLLISQYRHDPELYAGDPETKIAYPVFDSFDEDAKFVGVLSTRLFWRSHFTNILPESSKGMICVIENSFNQTFAYRVDGPDVQFLGEGDPLVNDTGFIFADMAASFDIDRESTRSIAETRSYTTVPLDTKYSKYVLKVYPTQDTANVHATNNPLIYTSLVASIFVLAAVVFLVYDHLVQKRQQATMEKAIANAHMAAVAERELNEYIAHEVRNPIAAALGACSFVRSAVTEEKPLQTKESRESVEEDVGIIFTSLRFINDLLRSMLDLHRASDHQLQIHKRPTDLLKDVLEPVSSMLYRRDDNFELLVECDENVMLEADCLRVKQIMLNLGRNSAKFVQKGFIRLRAGIVDRSDGMGDGRTIRLYVEDSGPGIPMDKRRNLFAKFQESLDLLNQGTGIGLCLCKHLCDAMGGEIWLDESYDSGIAGCVGTRFVIDLKTEPVDAFTSVESLAICSDVIQKQRQSLTLTAMDGDIVPSAVVGEGSCEGSCEEVVIDVEKATTIATVSNVDKQESQNTEEISCDESLPSELSVLFVDDDMVLRKLFRRSIKKALPGWAVKEAANGETALRMVDEEEFDVIFLDQYMASTEKQLLGTEATRELRAKGVKSVICGLSANDTEEAFLSAGADAFILKPLSCDKSELLKQLRELPISPVITC